MVITKLLISNNRPGTPLKATTLTVHNTANPDTIARNNRDYFANHPGASASTHYVVDDREVILCIPEDEVSWHAGSVANHSSISLEVCEFTNPQKQQHANQLAAELVADILARHSWGMDKIRTHRDWTGKYCPRKLLPIWESFLKMVGEALASDSRPDPLAVAIKILSSHGIINSPDYWSQVARAGQMAKGEFVYLLLINMAQYLDHGR